MKNYVNYLKNLILQKVVKQEEIIKLNLAIIHLYFQCVLMTMNNILTSGGLTVDFDMTIDKWILYSYESSSIIIGCIRLRHKKNKGMRQLHASSQNSEAIDVGKVARHPPSRRVVACDDYSFKNTIDFFLF